MNTLPITTAILTINRGSSSLKFALFDAGSGLNRVLEGSFDRIGLPGTRLSFTDLRSGQQATSAASLSDHRACLDPLVDLLQDRVRFESVRAVAHRVVHGGVKHREPQLVDDALLGDLERLSPFDPAHLPAEIGLMRAFRSRYPALPQVACFDTAFHRDLPRVAELLPIPRRFLAQGVRRYGFHGLSFAYLIEELERQAGKAASRGRVLLAHLGNGASLAAVREGRCLDTTMAFTPTAGLVMSTRSGDLDPGLAAYLAQVEGMTPQQFHDMVNHQSGLLGISETSSDVRDLLEREAEDSRAAEALALFCYQTKKWIGALAAAMGGLDTLVFAGGIGEHAAAIRARICDGLGFLGLEVDPARNLAHAAIISPDHARTTVRVIPTDEQLYMARVVSRLMAEGRLTPALVATNMESSL